MKMKVVLTYLFFSRREFLALAEDAASSYLGRSTRRTAGPGHIWSQSCASRSSHTSKHSAALEGISCENWLNLPTLARQPSSQTSKHSAQAGNLFSKYSFLEASFVILSLAKSVKISFIQNHIRLLLKAYSAMTVPNFKDKTGVFCKIMALDTPYQHIWRWRTAGF